MIISGAAFAGCPLFICLCRYGKTAFTACVPADLQPVCTDAVRVSAFRLRGRSLPDWSVVSLPDDVRIFSRSGKTKPGRSLASVPVLL